MKHKLGLLADPFKYCNTAKEETEKAMDVALELATRSIVLLHNATLNAGSSSPLPHSQRLPLPLPSRPRTLCVLGPLADDADAPLGNWRAEATQGSAVSVLKGIERHLQQRHVQDSVVAYHKGCELYAEGHAPLAFHVPVDLAPACEDAKQGFKAAAEAALQATSTVMVSSPRTEHFHQSSILAPPSFRCLEKAASSPARHAVRPALHFHRCSWPFCRTCAEL